MIVFSVPQTALAIGLGERYRYWSGASRKRYLFTRSAPAHVADFDDAVVVAARAGHVVWTGDAERFGTARRSSALDGCEFYVHLLAGSVEERARVIDDLRPARPTLALAA